MGSGTWSAATYRKRASARDASGADAFEYSRRARSARTMDVHPTLNPYGLIARESRDSAEHPASNAILIALDQTGSMTRVVRQIHSDLPQLLELLLGHNYIPHPQIMFTAVGDATSDQVPLQIGQFESDNRMDENLEHMILEGGGGPYGMESYELMLYTAAHHTTIDCYEKRQKRGYLFMIGDEMAYPAVKRDEVQRLIGAGLQTDIPLAQIVDEARRKYHLYFIIPAGASGGDNPNIVRFWNEALGPQHVIRLDNPADISETIALAIGLREGTIDLTRGLDDLRKLGSDTTTIDNVSTALRTLGPGGALATTDGDGRDLAASDDDPASGSSGSTRRL